MSDEIRLTSVNWELGMLLTPEHFRRQERYFDASLLWLLRYATNVYGLVGGGPRLPESERGAVRYDPIVQVDEDEQKLNLAVSQCRGLTPSGCIVDVDNTAPLRRGFEKTELEGVAECTVYVVVDPLEKAAREKGVPDEANPQLPSERGAVYRLKVHVHADEAPYSLAVAKLARSSYGASFQKDDEYIPPCTTMVSHSSLAAAWRQIVEQVHALSRRYTELHQAMQHYLALARERGIDTESDAEILAFVGRMVVALEECIYEILDSSQSPHRLLAHLRRFFHSAAVYRALSPPVGEYFELLKSQGEAEYTALIEQQNRALAITPRWQIHDDLRVEVRSTLASLGALATLERGLEGKYVDFRLNPALEAMNFIFDRQGNMLYRLVGRAQRVQALDGRLTLVFAGLTQENRASFRLVLTTEQNHVFDVSTRVSVEIRLNEGAGYKRTPVYQSATTSLNGQCNVEFDFDAADVPLITDIRVAVDGHFPVRAGLLFARQWFYVGQQREPRLEPAGQPAPPSPPPAPKQPPPPGTPKQPPPPVKKSRLE